MTKNIHTIVVEESHDGDKDEITLDWRELYTRKTWRFNRGNIKMAKSVLEHMASLMGVSVHVQEEIPVSVPMAYEGKTN
jgi:hypothetical protein